MSMEYKGYKGTVEYSAEDHILHGSVIGLKASLNYEGSSLDELEEYFRRAVDGYLTLCETDGLEAEQPPKILQSHAQ